MRLKKDAEVKLQQEMADMDKMLEQELPEVISSSVALPNINYSGGI